MSSMNITFIGAPDPVRLYQVMGSILGERYGAEVRLERIKDSGTGEVLWEREAEKCS